MKKLITLLALTPIMLIAFVGCEEAKKEAPADTGNESVAYKVNDWTPVAHTSHDRDAKFNVQFNEAEYNSRPIVAAKANLPTTQDCDKNRQYRMMQDEERISLPAAKPPEPIADPSFSVVDEEPNAPTQDPVVNDLVDDLDTPPQVQDEPAANDAPAFRTETRYRRVAKTRYRQVCGPMGTCRMVPETYYVNEPYTVQIQDAPATTGGCGCGCANCNCAPNMSSTTVITEGTMPLSAGTLPLFTEEVTYTYGNGSMIMANGGNMQCDNCPQGVMQNSNGNFVPTRAPVFRSRGGSGRPRVTMLQNFCNRVQSRVMNRRQARCQRWGFCN